MRCSLRSANAPLATAYFPIFDVLVSALHDLTSLSMRSRDMF
jgi:hypothetical protein